MQDHFPILVWSRSTMDHNRLFSDLLRIWGRGSDIGAWREVIRGGNCLSRFPRVFQFLPLSSSFMIPFLVEMCI